MDELRKAIEIDRENSLLLPVKKFFFTEIFSYTFSVISDFEMFS